jgi:hypothetical protein
MGFDKIVKLIANKNTKEKDIDLVVSKMPLIELGTTIEKLKRYRFQKYKFTKVMLDKLRKKKGW